MTNDFPSHPHRTLLQLSVPVLISLIAEPLTGLVDTAFIARLGTESLSALGVGTIVLSSIFWIFNFLGIGIQTEVAQAFGSGENSRSSELVGMALALAAAFGLLVLLAGLPCATIASAGMGAEGDVSDFSSTYIRIRLAGGPAVLLTLVAFGAMRGLQDMKTPLWIALGVNGLNILLDYFLIFGFASIPALGIAGAAWASVISQWVGAAWALTALYRQFGLPNALHRRDMRNLLVIGGDLFVRTGLLTAFLILTTRAATQMGPEGGAAHQAIRQFWTFTALLLDAFAIAGQSLVGYFIGSRSAHQARHVAYVVCLWSVVTGVILSIGMWAGESYVIRLLVPADAVGVFSGAWIMAAWFQPLNALSFATDGLHWGTKDFRYLRNAVMAATFIAGAGVFLIDVQRPDALLWIWLTTGGWIFIRALLGIVRIWPGVGNSPFGKIPS